MTPRPSELIASVRSLLDQVIAPDLTSGYARSLLAEVRLALAQFDWDEGVLSYVHETERLGELASDLAEWCGTDRGRVEHFAGLLQMYDLDGSGSVGSSSTLHGYGQVEAIRRAVDAWIVAAMDPLKSWIDSSPQDAEALVFWSRIEDEYLDTRASET